MISLGTQLERVNTGRDEKRPPVFSWTKVWYYNRVGAALRCEESNQGADKHERRKRIRTEGWRQSLRENVDAESLW